AFADTETFEIERSEAEWRKLLTPEQYHVLREEGTDYPGTSPLLEEHRKGAFACAGCDLPVYSSETKFASGTGWPSFWQEVAGNIGQRRDTSFRMVRMELHCHRCGGHRVNGFSDGPPPTRLRNSTNSLSSKFPPAQTKGACLAAGRTDRLIE